MALGLSALVHGFLDYSGDRTDVQVRVGSGDLKRRQAAQISRDQRLDDDFYSFSSSDFQLGDAAIDKLTGGLDDLYPGYCNSR